MNKKKAEPWRIIVGIISIAYIVFLWVKKNLVTVYSTIPGEQLLPVVATTVAVSLLKVAAIGAIILVVKWIAGKISNKHK